MFQDTLVFLIVAAAVAYLVRTWWQSSCGEKGCGGCSSKCGNAEKSTLQQSSAPIQIQMNGRSLQLSPREAPAAPNNKSQPSDTASRSTPSH